MNPQKRIKSSQSGSVSNENLVDNSANQRVVVLNDLSQDDERSARNNPDRKQYSESDEDQMPAQEQARNETRQSNRRHSSNRNNQGDNPNGDNNRSHNKSNNSQFNQNNASNDNSNSSSDSSSESSSEELLRPTLQRGRRGRTRGRRKRGWGNKPLDWDAKVKFRAREEQDPLASKSKDNSFEDDKDPDQEKLKVFGGFKSRYSNEASKNTHNPFGSILSQMRSNSKQSSIVPVLLTHPRLPQMLKSLSACTTSLEPHPLTPLLHALLRLNKHPVLPIPPSETPQLSKAGPDRKKKPIDHYLDTISTCLYKKRDLDLLINPCTTICPFEMWAPRQIAIFEEGILKFGKQFEFLAELIGTKTVKDVYEFYLEWKGSSHYKVYRSFIGGTKTAADEIF